jgi:hypothetical protein
MSGNTHPDKTFIGRIERRFDFLGYHFSPEGLTLAAKTIEQFVARAFRLYEQEPGETEASSRFGLYVRRWVRWVARAPHPQRTSNDACRWLGSIYLNAPASGITDARGRCGGSPPYICAAGICRPLNLNLPTSQTTISSNGGRSWRIFALIPADPVP